MTERRKLGRRAIAVAAAVLGCTGAFWSFQIIHSASTGLQTAKTQVAHESQYAVRRMKLDQAIASGFEPVSSPAQFTDAVVFQGKLFLCGPGGLLAFNPDGRPSGEWHVGRELPAAPLVQMGLGSGQQLWIATHGAGLLNFDGRVFEQVRPDDALARSLTAVLPLSTGGVVVGTEKAGALIWDGHSLRPLHGSLNGFHVSALAGSDTDLWVGTIDRGLLHWHAG
ncbi:MAG: hypothetical protein JO022_18660, partial [Acidobacteriaceae bacterium]|nr:hypothetical protein [Acidobacteriaceae bacterium]